MLPEAKNEDLLYVTSQDTGVEVFSYPKGKLVGTLTGFSTPMGECVDKAGNVYVVNRSAKIVEYAHGGKTPLRSLRMLNDRAYLTGCSVDRATGNLAVTANVGVSYYATVWIYTKAKGVAQSYYDSDIASYLCGYDTTGNLFVDGTGKDGFAFAEHPKGRSTFTNISISGGTINLPGGVQSHGKYIAVGDQEYQSTNASAIYQVSVSGSTGTLEGVTPLTGAIDVVQFWIQGATVIGPDAERNCGASPRGCVEFWKYPAGGSYSKALAVSEPFGSAISLASH